MRACLQGRDSMVVLPTGAGKSVCYQLPAIVRGGVTVVFSPLLALARDQVDALDTKGIPTVWLSSLQSRADRDSEMDELSEPTSEVRLYRSHMFELHMWPHANKKKVRLLYLSPETMLAEDVRVLLKRLHVQDRLKLFAIDEAHCVLNWSATPGPGNS